MMIVPNINAGYCYLIDSNAACAVCWQTTYESSTDIKGVRGMDECPAGVVAKWTDPIPFSMRAMETYNVGYSLQLDTTKFDTISRQVLEQPNRRTQLATKKLQSACSLWHIAAYTTQWQYLVELHEVYKQNFLRTQTGCQRHSARKHPFVHQIAI